MNTNTLSGITDSRSGDYYDKATDQYLCVAFELGKPKIIGGYSKSACLQEPRFKSMASKRVWANYFGIEV